MTTPEPGSFFFGGATDALSADADVNVAQALWGPSQDERQRVGFPNFTEPQAAPGASPDPQENQFQYDMMFGQGYRDWRHQFSSRFGEQPNYNDPLFDYRAAWRGGARPEPYEPDTVGGEPQYHWPSSVQNPPRTEAVHLKQPGHPTYWMEPFMGQYGVDPNDPSAGPALVNALSDPNVGPLIPGNPQLDPRSSDALMQEVTQAMLRRLGGVEP